MTALLGLSIARVAAFDPWALSLGGAVIGAVAAGVDALFQQPIASLEEAIPPRKRIGMRIATVGFLIALGGWLVAVFLSRSAGYYIVVAGIGVGFIGIIIHFINLIPWRD